MSMTLLEKVWDAHTVRKLPNGQTQLFVGLHLVHEVTSPQAFDMLRARGWKVRYPSRTIATVDHIVPTRDQRRPFMDVMAEDMLSALERNCREAGVPLLDLNSGVAGHRARHRARARPDAAGHDDCLRRQPHVDARRVRRGRVRHRHVAGARRARVAVPGARSAEGPAHRRVGTAGARASTRRTSSSRSSGASASTAASATPTSTPATPSSACRWTSG